MISRETIDEVKSRVDIVDVISDFISLKRSGVNYKAMSPFSNEKTPSFFVVPAKGIFKDFSSGKGGDAITFVMEHEGMSYLEAIRFLGKKYGVEIQETVVSDELREQQSEREGLYILMNFAKDYYHQNLFESEEGKAIGLSYFRERGFNDRSIQKFELGYALEGWNNLSDEAIKKNYNKDLLEKTGLIVKNEEGRTYDRFRGRVIFPVHNLSGKVIAFGARMLGKDKNQPKYINSPETEIYHKSNVLYGLYQAKNAIRQKDNCFLVEGYTDVLSMHQSDVENVVASSGTALTEEQIKLIKRFTENVTVLFDGDAAGIKAALRGIDLILKGGLNVRVVLLPDNDDPDSYSKKVGTSEFQKYLAQKSQDFISFKSGLFAAEAGNDPIRKAESIKEIVGSIALIPDPIKRSVYLQETSHQLKIGESVLLTELNKLLIEERKKREKDGSQPSRNPFNPAEIIEHIADATTVSPDAKDVLFYPEREAIRLMLNYMDNAFDDEKVVDFMIHELDDVEFSSDVFRDIYNHIHEVIREGGIPSSDELILNGSPEVKNAVAGLMTSKYHISPHWKKKNIYVPEETENLSHAVTNNVLFYKFRIIQKMISDNLLKIREAEASGNDSLLEETMGQQQELKNAERELASRLTIVVSK
ncbi:MAG: DNA primase [Cyclobacteriaceae bacterium]|nr:DNA primase [Cyclobacteriaceae bacterium]